MKKSILDWKFTDSQILLISMALGAYWGAFIDLQWNELVEVGLVFEVAFDAVHLSSRHKSGLAMRFPRIHRIRWDKPAQEADRVEGLLELV